MNVTVPDAAVTQNGGAFVWEQLPCAWPQMQR